MSIQEQMKLDMTKNLAVLLGLDLFRSMASKAMFVP